ncbi:MAG TPA: hypothetical protein VGN12_02300 [Pirellulales bacterium]|jgi:hypothetical protein
MNGIFETTPREMDSAARKNAMTLYTTPKNITATPKPTKAQTKIMAGIGASFPVRTIATAIAIAAAIPTTAKANAANLVDRFILVRP